MHMHINAFRDLLAQILLSAIGVLDVKLVSSGGTDAKLVSDRWLAGRDFATLLLRGAVRTVCD